LIGVFVKLVECQRDGVGESKGLGGLVGAQGAECWVGVMQTFILVEGRGCVSVVGVCLGCRHEVL